MSSLISKWHFTNIAQHHQIPLRITTSSVKALSLASWSTHLKCNKSLTYHFLSDNKFDPMVKTGTTIWPQPLRTKTMHMTCQFNVKVNHWDNQMYFFVDNTCIPLPKSWCIICVFFQISCFCFVYLCLCKFCFLIEEF